MNDSPKSLVAIAVETSGSQGSVLVARGETVLAGDTFKVEQQHGVQLLPTVDSLSKKAGLQPGDFDAIYVSGGPGSFTGLRIGITFAKAMAFALNCKVVRVPSLDVLAQNALDLDPQPARVISIFDAKRGNVFGRTFELRDGMYEPIDEPKERAPREYLAQHSPANILGAGVERHREVIDQAAGITIAGSEYDFGRAEWVLKLGARLAAKNQFITLDELIPIYIRKPDAEEKWEARQAANAGSKE
ncbi:MAG: tRNA (adenosine(37)-N6)-threonylcarbamoyltransferase complex dimerization subunit type 1 TsaB [Phycisphaerae bacterium]|nr:MAG: tRNA (adenosine(37)-N6)-threonylcarbamoyltransferase complex dimerization subunit type 1 TsaB [Phycisphaerae bacterium]